MANRNQYYCLIGIGKQNSDKDLSAPFRLQLRVVDLVSQKVIAKMGMGVNEVGESNLEEHISKWVKGIIGQQCYQYMIFPANDTGQSTVARLLVNRAPTLNLRSYAEGHHSKMMIFDKGKHIYWRLVPTCLWTFEFTSDDQVNESEFDKFFDYMVSEVGLESFCKRYTSSQNVVRRRLAPKLSEEPNTADKNGVHASLAVAESEFGMNSGGRHCAKRPYEVLPVIGLDINSMYTQIMLENTFSSSKVRKFRLGKYPYENIKIWNKIIEVMDDLHGKDKWQVRVVADIQKARIKPGKSMRLHDSSFIKSDLKVDPIAEKNYCRRNCVDKPAFTGVMEFFISEIPEFLDCYDVGSFTPKIMLQTFCSRFSKGVREVAFSVFRDAKHNKNDRNLAATSKVIKNALPGFYQMNPAKYIYHKSKKTEEQIVNEVAAQLDHGKANGKYPNILAGPEITKHGRDLHHKLQEFFESRGCEVVYGNTDSIYVLADSAEKRENIFHIMNIWNKINYRKLRKSCQDLSNWVEMSPKNAVGGLKVEFDGYIVHAGINQMLKAGSDYKICGGAISPLKWEDLFYKNNESMDIRDMVYGRKIDNVNYIVQSNGVSQVVKKPWEFK